MTSSHASLEDIVAYTVAYCELYRTTFISQTSPAGGLPAVAPPTYASMDPLKCFVARDGAIFADQSQEPVDGWEIAGGPALKVDFEPTRTPPQILELLKREGLYGKPIGIYRIVAQDLPNEIWSGRLPPGQSFVTQTTFGKSIAFLEVDADINEILSRLTYGAFGPVLNIHLKDNSDNFWEHFRVEKLGFFPADYSSKRYFRLLEISHNRDAAAWDKRSLWLRVKFDCYRDILTATQFAEGDGGMLGHFQDTDFTPLLDKTRRFEALITQLQDSLLHDPDAYEAISQAFLEKHPEMLDLYGRVVSRPRFVYPEGKSPTGKQHVEPDFVVTYSDGSFRIIEIERPGKPLVKIKGDPRSEVTQAAFQLSEFRNFVERHPDVLQELFPGIQASSCRYTLIIGRERASAYKSFSDLRTHVRATYGADDVWVFDDLVTRARMALDAFRGLARLVIN